MSKAYYEAHKEELKAKNNARRRANPEKYKAAAKAWREAHPEYAKEYMRKWRAENREHLREYARANVGKYASRRATYARKYQLKYQYNLTPEELRDMEVGQAGRCLICLRVPPRSLVVDHDHATGKIRGLLCNPCNRLLGIARDDIKVLASAQRYLAAS
jgi:hypothetical protein